MENGFTDLHRILGLGIGLICFIVVEFWAKKIIF